MQHCHLTFLVQQSVFLKKALNIQRRIQDPIKHFKYFAKRSIFFRFVKYGNAFPADNYMFKLTIETLEKGVKYVQS